jgi:hypothetical protein
MVLISERVFTMLRLHRAGCFCLIVALAGCSKGPGLADFIPDADRGKQALEKSLEAWKAGQPMSTITRSGDPSITPLDSDWKEKKKLASYQILNEIPTTEGPKQFAARLTFQGEQKPVDAVYYVVGRDPLWVFRDADYKRQSGM